MGLSRNRSKTDQRLANLCRYMAENVLTPEQSFTCMWTEPLWQGAQGRGAPVRSTPYCDNSLAHGLSRSTAGR